MFELIEGTDRLPVHEDSIAQILSGMNKVRVSVGNYVSEPSDVYIVSSVDGALFRSYIVFFIVEHRIHMIYGHSDNPYDPAVREGVLKEAVDFVEEMGTILEEVPWEKMSPEERRDWLDNESIYPQDDVNEIVDLEELEPEELREVVEEDQFAVEEDETQTETPESEVLEEEPLPVEEVDDQGVAEENLEEEMEDDGDFDNLLKQAFLKPDLVKKSMLKKASILKGEKQEDDQSIPDGEDVQDNSEESGTMEDSESAEVGMYGTDDEAAGKPDSTGSGEEIDEQDDMEVSDEDLAIAGDEDLSALIQEINDEISDDAVLKNTSIPAQDSSDQTRLTVIRYLSRF